MHFDAFPEGRIVFGGLIQVREDLQGQGVSQAMIHEAVVLSELKYPEKTKLSITATLGFDNATAFEKVFAQPGQGRRRALRSTPLYKVLARDGFTDAEVELQTGIATFRRPFHPSFKLVQNVPHETHAQVSLWNYARSGLSQLPVSQGNLKILEEGRVIILESYEYRTQFEEYKVLALEEMMGLAFGLAASEGAVRVEEFRVVITQAENKLLDALTSKGPLQDRAQRRAIIDLHPAVEFLRTFGFKAETADGYIVLKRASGSK